ncbi:hypothetical protein BDW22DRAFT_1360451 [Trametopsis cervina]|nr:hypothetical protein BDW22DRAFT_1360451 [Trametopsis cervina]
MPRAFHLPAVIFLLAAFSMLFFVALSLPFFPALDLVRVRFEGVSGNVSQQVPLSELRYGTWGYCWYNVNGERYCSAAGHAYTTTVFNADKSSLQLLPPQFTSGLAIHPAAAGLTFVALFLSLFTNFTVALLAALTTLVCALLTLGTIATDLALYSAVKYRMGRLTGVRQHTDVGTGFWMVFASFVLLSLAGFMACFGRRRDRMSSATSYSMVPHKHSWRDRFTR